MIDYLTEKQKIIERIESNLMAFDLSEIGKLTGIPLGLYQRFFSYIYGISITAYIRKRKLTVSASKLLLKEWSVTTAAFECGYEDSSSFSRAFKEQFTVSPSNITLDRFEMYKFEKFSISNVLSAEIKKADIVAIEYPKVQAQYLVGIDSEQHGLVGSDLWQIYQKKHIGEQLCKIEKKLHGNFNDDYIAVGYMTDFEDSGSLGKTYMIGRFFKEKPAKERGLKMLKIDAMQLVHSKIAGKHMEDIIDGAYALTCDLARKNGYEIQYAPFFWMEYYNSEFFRQNPNRQQQLVLDFYLPCKKTDRSFGGIQ